MTDETVQQNNEAQQTQTEAAVSNTEQATQNETVKDTQGEQEEKLLKQSHVNEIAKDRYDAGRKKGKEEALREFSEQASSSADDTPVNTQGGQLTEDQIRKMIDQQSARRAQELLDKNTGEDFLQKINSHVKEKPEVLDKLKNLGLLSLPMQTVHVLNGVDNIANVLDDMATNRPEKFVEIVTTATWNPALAKNILTKYSDSIRKNQDAAAKHRSAPEPLDQIASSPTTGVGDDKMTVSDFKKMPWLRG